MSYPLELSGVAGMITVGGALSMCAAQGGLVASVEALRRQLPAAADLHDRLAIDLEVDRDTITEAWFVASAFPPATRRSGLPWTTYLILRFHPERHELVDRAASAGRTSPHRLGWTAYSSHPSADLRPVGRGPVAGRGGPMSPRSGSVPQLILGAPVGSTSAEGLTVGRPELE